MTYNPAYQPTGVNNKVNEYYKTWNHVRTARNGVTRALLLSGGATLAYAVAGFSPAVVLDFKTNEYFLDSTATTLDAATTYTGASASTYTDSSGVLQTALAGVPRVGNHVYNGTTWVNEGLLLESEARTNLITYSSDYTNAAWVKLRLSSFLADATGPDGAVSATTLTAGSTGGQAPAYTGFQSTVATATAYTFSAYLKAGTMGHAVLYVSGYTTPADAGYYFDLSSGTIGSAEGTATGITPLIEAIGGGWYRCSVTFTTDATDTSGETRVYLAEADGDFAVPLDGLSSILAYGAQLELGATPLSYIPTSGAAATRAAQTLEVAGADMPAYTDAVSIAIDGQVTYADNNNARECEFTSWGSVRSSSLYSALSTSGARSGQVTFYQNNVVFDFVVSDPAFYAPGINVAFNIASRNGSTFVNGAIDATLLSANTTPTGIADLSAEVFKIGPTFNGNIGTVRVWPVDITDAGIEEAST